MLNSLRDLIAGNGKAVPVTLAPEAKRVTAPTRVLADGKAIELALGKQALRLYPETPITSDSEARGNDWILVDPERYFSRLGGFLRLKSGQSVVIGRGEDRLCKIFDFRKSVMRRHVALVNDNGEIIVKPLDNDKPTYVSSVPESEDVKSLAARQVKDLKCLRSIFGGPIELLGPKSAIAVLEQVHDILSDEAYRPKNSHDRPGGLLDLPGKLSPIVVGDIHAQLDNLLKILSLIGCLDGLERGDSCLLFLGDTVHREGEDELEEMDSSLLTLDLLFSLKVRFPKNVFFLRGNHESFGEEVGKGGVPQARLLWRHARALRGKKYAKRLAECFDLLAYLAKSGEFIACHGGPPRRKTSLRSLIDVQDDPELAREIVWNRLRRTGRPEGYSKREVKMLREAVGAKKDTPLIVSHTPLSRTGAIWTDAGDIAGHHIMFSANPDKLGIFVRSGCDMIPLEFPGEALLDFTNAL